MSALSGKRSAARKVTKKGTGRKVEKLPLPAAASTSMKKPEESTATVGTRSRRQLPKGKREREICAEESVELESMQEDEKKSKFDISILNNDSSTLPIDEDRFNSLSTTDQSKLRAAYNAVDECISDNQVIGIGSGSTVVYAVERIKQRVEAEGLRLKCIPTSYQALDLIQANHLELSNLTSNPVIDVTIDGADEITADMVCIKGGGGCHLQEKIVASCSKKMIVVCDWNKVSQKLGTKWVKGVPVEIVSLAKQPVMNAITAMGGKATLRMAQRKAGPVVTDNGNFIVDAVFGELSGKNSPEIIHKKLSAIVGVVETGLFIGLVHKAYVGTDYGTVEFMST